MDKGSEYDNLYINIWKDLSPTGPPPDLHDLFDGAGHDIAAAGIEGVDPFLFIEPSLNPSIRDEDVGAGQPHASFNPSHTPDIEAMVLPPNSGECESNFLAGLTTFQQEGIHTDTTDEELVASAEDDSVEDNNLNSESEVPFEHGEEGIESEPAPSNDNISPVIPEENDCTTVEDTGNRKRQKSKTGNSGQSSPRPKRNRRVEKKTKTYELNEEDYINDPKKYKSIVTSKNSYENRNKNAQKMQKLADDNVHLVNENEKLTKRVSELTQENQGLQEKLLKSESMSRQSCVINNLDQNSGIQVSVTSGQRPLPGTSGKKQTVVIELEVPLPRSGDDDKNN